MYYLILSKFNYTTASKTNTQICRRAPRNSAYFAVFFFRARFGRHRCVATKPGKCKLLVNGLLCFRGLWHNSFTTCGAYTPRRSPRNWTRQKRYKTRSHNVRRARAKALTRHGDASAFVSGACRFQRDQQESRGGPDPRVTGSDASHIIFLQPPCPRTRPQRLWVSNLSDLDCRISLASSIDSAHWCACGLLDS